MKQLLKITLFAAFCGFTTVAFSQISFGVKAGLNLANVNFTGDGTDLFETKIVPTFQVGGILEIGLTNSFAIQTGVSLQGKGFKITVEDLEGTENLYYVQVPAHFLYRGGSFFVGAGPYAGFGVSGKAKTKSNGQTDTEDIAFGSTEDDDVSALDFGVGIQAGASVGSLRFGAGYDLGLIDITPKDVREDGYSIKHGVINVFVAYMFGN